MPASVDLTAVGNAGRRPRPDRLLRRVGRGLQKRDGLLDEQAEHRRRRARPDVHLLPVQLHRTRAAATRARRSTTTPRWPRPRASTTPSRTTSRRATTTSARSRPSTQKANAANWKISDYSLLAVQQSAGSTVTQDAIKTSLAAGKPVVIAVCRCTTTFDGARARPKSRPLQPRAPASGPTAAATPSPRSATTPRASASRTSGARGGATPATPRCRWSVREPVRLPGDGRSARSWSADPKAQARSTPHRSPARPPAAARSAPRPAPTPANPTDFAYQWQRDGADIAGATRPHSYTTVRRRR